MLGTSWAGPAPLGAWPPPSCAGRPTSTWLGLKVGFAAILPNKHSPKVQSGSRCFRPGRCGLGLLPKGSAIAHNMPVSAVTGARGRLLSLTQASGMMASETSCPEVCISGLAPVTCHHKDTCGSRGGRKALAFTRPLKSPAARGGLAPSAWGHMRQLGGRGSLLETACPGNCHLPQDVVSLGRVPSPAERHRVWAVVLQRPRLPPHRRGGKPTHGCQLAGPEREGAFPAASSRAGTQTSVRSMSMCCCRRGHPHRTAGGPGGSGASLQGSSVVLRARRCLSSRR